MTRSGALREAREISAMFGRIVRRYDMMNRLMTGGRDIAWRRLAARAAVADGAARALDVATGTGDLALALLEAGAESVVGLDFAPPMTEAAELKAVNEPRATFIVGDAMKLPFANGEFDACTVSFGLRNMAGYQEALTEMSRVLRPGGRLVCLELTPCRTPILGRMFGWYFSTIVPAIGGIVSGDREAYRYLPASVEGFPDARSLAAMMANADLTGIKWKLLGVGTVALHVGVKPDHSTHSKSAV